MGQLIFDEQKEARSSESHVRVTVRGRRVVQDWVAPVAAFKDMPWTLRLFREMDQRFDISKGSFCHNSLEACSALVRALFVQTEMDLFVASRCLHEPGLNLFLDDLECPSLFSEAYMAILAELRRDVLVERVPIHGFRIRTNPRHNDLMRCFHRQITRPLPCVQYEMMFMIREAPPSNAY